MSGLYKQPYRQGTAFAQHTVTKVPKKAKGREQETVYRERAHFVATASLPDGSTVDLGNHSKMAEAFTAGMKAIDGWYAQKAWTAKLQEEEVGA
ncbi:MAG: hypothetical protein LCH53_04555 [Bacteroidetes bacterium]|nr:hypothetical protein [Bacteroidota bacterium]